MKKKMILIFLILSTGLLTGFNIVTKQSIDTYTQKFNISCIKPDHALYVSICQIEYNTKLKSAEIAIKVFTDDLEKAVSGANNGISLHLNTKQEHVNSDALIRDYLLKSLNIKLNNKNSNLKWIGKEYETGEAVWCYFEAPCRQNLKSVWVHNTIFTEIYPKQNNIVQVKTVKTKKSLSLSKDENEGSLSF